MMDDILSLQRRSFLQHAAGAAAVAGLTSSSSAAVLASATKTVVLFNSHDAASTAFAAAAQAQGQPVLALSNDVVLQWREQLQALVQAGYRLQGRTAYADFFMLRGLAAEQRLYVAPERQHASGNFDWVI